MPERQLEPSHPQPDMEAQDTQLVLEEQLQLLYAQVPVELPLLGPLEDPERQVLPSQPQFVEAMQVVQ